MNVVYYVRNGERNEELRYSLRSLANLEHERVFIVGHTPRWVTGVESIPGNLVHAGPQQTAVDNLKRACHAVDAESFVVFNDDFYVMQPMEEVPNWNAGPLVDKAASTGGGYGNALKLALRQLRAKGIAEPLAWTLHIPVVVLRGALRVVLENLVPDRRILPEWRTMYGNLVGAQGEQHPDCKVWGRGEIPDGPFLSSVDSGFRRVLPLLRERFPRPCAYEVTA